MKENSDRKIIIIIKDDKLSTECVQLVGMLWRRILGDESEVTRFRHQGDECHHCGGNQGDECHRCGGNQA